MTGNQSIQQDQPDKWQVAVMITPKVHKQLSLSEVLHLIPGYVVYGHTLIPTQLQATEDVEQQIQVVVPAIRQTLLHDYLPHAHDQAARDCIAHGDPSVLTCSASASPAHTAQRWGRLAACSLW